MGSLLNRFDEMQVKVIDTPGYDEGDQEDQDHHQKTLDYLKQEIKFVNMFILTLSGTDHRIGRSTKQLIKKLEDSMEAKFWDHFAIIYTHWDSSDYAKNVRERQELTEAGRIKQITDLLNNDYPGTVGKDLKVYFLDNFEINDQRNDPTSQVY